MGIKNAAIWRKTQHRLTISLTNVSGDYGDAVMTIGKVGAGEAEQSYTAVTVLIEGNPPAGSSVELWLPRVTGGDKAASDRDDGADYYFAGQVVWPARAAAGSSTGITNSFGSGTFSLAGYPGAQLRARSGGSAGPITISASAV